MLEVLFCPPTLMLSRNPSGPLNRLNAILSVLHPIDRYGTPSATGSAIGRPYLASKALEISGRRGKTTASGWRLAKSSLIASGANSSPRPREVCQGVLHGLFACVFFQGQLAEEISAEESVTESASAHKVQNHSQ